jgi:hypothetical protein
MNRITADRALFQRSRSVFGSKFLGAKRTRPAVSLVRIPLPVNQNLEFLEERAGAPDWGREGHGREEHGRTEPAWARWLILAEELLGVFDEADDHDYGGAGHAHEEHDLQDVHCEQSDLEHVYDCSRDCGRFPSRHRDGRIRIGCRSRRVWRNLLCLFEIGAGGSFADSWRSWRRIQGESGGALLNSAPCAAFHGGFWRRVC